MSDTPQVVEIVDGEEFVIEQTDNGPREGDELVPDGEVWEIPEGEEE